MPHLSKRAVFTNELVDAVISHSMFTNAHKLLCDDSDGGSSDEELLSFKIVAAVQYAAMCNVHFIFRDTKYHPDVRGRRLGYGLPEWRKIVLGHKYNEEEFIKIFCIPRSLFCSFVQLLKHHVSFCCNGLKQRKHYSTELQCSSLSQRAQACLLSRGSLKHQLARTCNAEDSTHGIPM